MMSIEDRIRTLRDEKGALILAHNYQITPIQELADFSGDSLQLSIKARDSHAKLIVFCGVRFMAETAAILNPGAKVLLPAEDAGCPMADMITAEQLRIFKAEYPDAKVVCYVNSSAEVKAESDVCCTSSNAVKILQSFPKDQTILFVPDQNLGSWAAKQAGRKVIVWEGYCPIHQWGFVRRNYDRIIKLHPDYQLIAHPECDEDIIEIADKVMSTGGMHNYVKDHDNLIIATDASFAEYLQHLYPEKQLISLNSRAKCRNMRKITLQKLLESLENEQYVVTVPPETAARALKALERMLELSA
jgi:quinolinate synthase